MSKEPVGDPVEAALAVALEGAAKAQRWELVGQPSRELETRRKAREAPNVVPIRSAKKDAP